MKRHEVVAGDVVVIRYEGPRGGPGMPEMLIPTATIAGMGLERKRCPHHRRQIFRRHTWTMHRTCCA